MYTKVGSGDAAYELEELAEQMYDLLGQMDDIIQAAATPDGYERARRYWMAHIDEALLNRKEWLGGSFISLKDTLEELRNAEEEGEEEDEE